jgi:hypothetical protein
MARFGFSESFISGRSKDECRAAATDTLERAGSKPSVDDRGRIVGTLGSKFLIRLLGAFLAPTTSFPVQISVAVSDAGDERQIDLRVEENFGIGSLKGIEQKVRGYCDQLGSELVATLKRALA